jgi:5'-3' exonuclease
LIKEEANCEMISSQNTKHIETPHPKPIKIAVPYIQDLLKAMHIPIIVAGYEADDLIGTIAKQAEKQTTKW